MDITRDEETRQWWGVSEDGTKVRVFRIPEKNLTTFTDRLAKLAKRATKLGLEAPTYTELKEEFVEVKVKVGEDDLGQSITEPRVVRYVFITVHNPKVVVSGHEFLAALEHTEEGNILHVLPGKSIPPLYRNCPANCDHCHTKRYRKETFILVETATGAYKQIGRNCLADYLGRDAERYADAAELYATVDELAEASEEDGEGGWGGGGPSYEMLDKYLSYVAEVISHIGWKSRSAAKFEGGGSTADEALRHIYRSPFSKEKDYLFRYPTEASMQVAKDAILWAESLSDEEVEPSDYLHTIRVIARRGVVGAKQFGFAASIVSSYQRHLGRLKLKEREATRAETSHWVGEVGERRIFELVVENVITIESQFGVSKLHIMSDMEGNVFTWFCSGAPLDTGKEYLVRGTIKAHTERKGVKQTQLSRCDEVHLFPYIVIIGDNKYDVAAEDEKDAKARIKATLELKRLPRGIVVVPPTPTEGVAEPPKEES